MVAFGAEQGGSVLMHRKEPLYLTGRAETAHHVPPRSRLAM